MGLPPLVAGEILLNEAHYKTSCIRVLRHFRKWSLKLPPDAVSISSMDMSATIGSTATVSTHLELGKLGEELAAAYLEHVGYRIVAANFSLPVGRNRIGAVINVEIDLVAYEGETLCFVEVKARSSDWFAQPQANVDRRKQRQIARAARTYRRMFGLTGAPFRYDVVTVVLPSAEERAAEFEIQLLRNYWTEDTLKKRIWSGTYWD